MDGWTTSYSIKSFLVVHNYLYLSIRISSFLWQSLAISCYLLLSAITSLIMKYQKFKWDSIEYQFESWFLSYFFNFVFFRHASLQAWYEEMFKAMHIQICVRSFWKPQSQKFLQIEVKANKSWCLIIQRPLAQSSTKCITSAQMYFWFWICSLYKAILCKYYIWLLLLNLKK